MTRPLRVHAFTRTIPAEYGYVGETKERVQQLQAEMEFGRWTTLDEEIVPEWALIEKGALGSTDWKSRFVDLTGVVFERKDTL